MPTERELKTQQEDRLFDILLLLQMLNEGKGNSINGYLGMMFEKAQSGMSADEIDAVKERVSRAFKSLNL